MLTVTILLFSAVPTTTLTCLTLGKFSSILVNKFKKKKKIYLLCWILVAAHKIFDL